MKKEKNKTLIISLCSVLLLGASALLINLPKENNIRQENNSNSEEIVLEPGLNQKDVKLRNNGDFVTLVANVNNDATIQGVTFETDRSDCVTVTRLSENSVKLTRIKEFKGIVTITATSNDIYSNFKETCSVRCYNKIASFDDTYSGFINDNEAFKFFEVDSVYLNQNYVTKVEMNISSSFGEADEPYTDGTFANIEEDDLATIKSQVENAFAPNKIINFQQRDNVDCSNNQITFNVDYKTDIFESNNSKSVIITCDEKTITLNLKKYVPVTSITFDNESMIVL